MSWDIFFSKKPKTSKEANALLEKAVKRGNARLAEFALQANASADTSCEYRSEWYDGNKYHYTHPVLWHAVTKGYTDVVQVLLKHGAAIEQAHDKRTPLMEAVLQGHTPVVRVLLDAWARFDVSYNYGDALLHAERNKFKDIVQMLKAEPARRAAIAEASKRAQEEAAALQKAAEEKAKRDEAVKAAVAAVAAVETAMHPERTAQEVQIMRPLRLKTEKRRGWFV